MTSSKGKGRDNDGVELTRALRSAGQRITLELPAVPLTLPGEEPLVLPEGIRVDGKAGISETPESHDAWFRERAADGDAGQERDTAVPSVESGTRRGSAVFAAAEAMELVDRGPRSSPIDLETEAKERFELGDFSGALRVAELLLGQDPAHGSAPTWIAASRERLLQLYASRLGGVDRVVRLSVRHGGVRWLGLDHRAGFLMSCVDGVSTVEDLIDISGMPRLEAMRTLVELLDTDVIEIGAPG